MSADAAATPEMVRVDRVSRSFNGTKAVDEVSFTLARGRFLTILGPSGSGKTTLLRMIAGFLAPTGGEIVLGGRPVSAEPPHRRSIGMVFQKLALFPHMTAAENVAYPLRMRRFDARTIPDRVERYLELVRLGGYGGRRIHELSGGQQQRVALGRAIIAEKPVCLMDEPLSNLDAKLRHEMRTEIRSLQRKLGITMLYVTHDQAEAIALADRIVLLHEGRIAQDAGPEAIYGAPANLTVARFIGTPPMNLLQLHPGANGHAVRGLERPLLRLPVARPLVLGLRPEDIAAVDSGGQPAVVEGLEYLGADSLVDCRLGAERLTVRLQGAQRLQAGEVLHLRWSPRAMHLFDADTGERLDELTHAAAGMATGCGGGAG